MNEDFKIFDVNGRKINVGDKVKGLWYHERAVTGVCKFNAEKAAYGIEWQRGNVTEFNPFCCLCNIEYEVTDE